MSPGEQYLPPVETTFGLAMRGYDRSQVAEHLRLVNAELRMIAADRDAAVDQAGQLAYQLDAARTETEKLRAQLTRMSEPPESVDGMSERLQWMLRLAQDEVRDMRARAEAEAESTRTAALAAAAEVVERNRKQTAHLDTEYARVQAEIEQHRTDTLAELDRLRSDSEQRRSTLDADSEKQRAEAEHDFNVSLTSRRTAAEAEFAELEARRRAEAARIADEAMTDAERVTAEAAEQADQMLTDARDEVIELRAIRERIKAQLAAARAALDRAVPALGPVPDEERLDRGSDRPGPAGHRDMRSGDTSAGNTTDGDTSVVETSAPSRASMNV